MRGTGGMGVDGGVVGGGAEFLGVVVGGLRAVLGGWGGVGVEGGGRGGGFGAGGGATSWVGLLGWGLADDVEWGGTVLGWVLRLGRAGCFDG